MEDFLRVNNHATNKVIIDGLRNVYPEISATTVHRITDRLVKNNKIILAPISRNNEMRFDTNIVPHDHFSCQKCDRLRDIELPDSIIQSINDLLSDCRINGNLIISGTCSNCLKKK